jgi:uncharacterized membrane protein YhaH (DUF805 family)
VHIALIIVGLVLFATAFLNSMDFSGYSNRVNWWWVAFGILGLLIFASGMHIVNKNAVEKHNRELEVCNSVNGSFVVIGQKEEMVGKIWTKVDVYGCVKR